MHAFLAPAELAYAFSARVLRTAAPSLAGVLSGTRPASLRSYSEGSYHTYLPVSVRLRAQTQRTATEPPAVVLRDVALACCR